MSELLRAFRRMPGYGEAWSMRCGPVTLYWREWSSGSRWRLFVWRGRFQANVTWGWENDAEVDAAREAAELVYFPEVVEYRRA